MTRKSKQPGGHNPLTYHEQKRLKFSGYGTQTQRLTTASHLPFGHCCLNLSPIEDDAVATPSGHIYSREAIVQYLLAQNGKLKKQKAEYERQRLEVENRRAEWEEKERKKNQDRFVQKDQGAMASSTALVVRSDDTDTAGRRASTSATAAASAASSAKSSQSAADRKVKVVENSLEHVSYWLATSQPEKNKLSASGQFDYEREIQQLPPPPPERPSSPMSGEPLKLKQLIPLNLVREGDEDGKSKKSGNKDSNTTGRILCAVSHKTITTQPTIVIKNTGQVMLKSVYKELAQPEMVCPITGKKFKEKDVIQLVSGKSGFAASGDVVAKKYHPTLT